MSTIDINDIKPNSYKYKEETAEKIKEKLKDIELERVKGEELGIKTKPHGLKKLQNGSYLKTSMILSLILYLIWLSQALRM